MSVKEIDKKMTGTAGLEKKINKGAERLVFDILQSTQYSNPVQSTIRELATNALDAQREKEIAIEILEGTSRSDDYYITRSGDQYDDSNFDPSYYDLDFLDRDNNEVTLIYEHSASDMAAGFCDTMYIVDHGVGIGERRLEGVLELGYSTKRNTAENYGAFGLGAKVALSTGVDFYTVETIHNGKRFKMNCYNYKTDFVIPPFNMESGEMNPTVKLSNGDEVHYERTSLKNGTTVSFKVKKYNRKAYRNAIEEQLMYMPQIKFFVRMPDELDRSRYDDVEKYFQPEILHDSDNLIISDSYVFDKPHILLVKEHGASTGVNYGFIDFRELEMEDMRGPVAFKCPARQAYRDEDGREVVIQEGVDVTPSREKVIWNESTKAFISGVLQRASEEASQIIESSLKEETDLIKWLLACRDVYTKMDRGSALSRLSGIIDKESIKPKFHLDKDIKRESTSEMFRYLDVQVGVWDRDENKVIRRRIDNWSQLSESNVFIMGGENHSQLKDRYLVELTGGGSVVFVKDRDPEFAVSATDLPEMVKKKREAFEKKKAKSKKVLEYMKASALSRSYDSITVPEEWAEEKKKIADAAEKGIRYSRLSPAERRALEDKIAVATWRFNPQKDNFSGSNEPFMRDKVEIKAKDLMEIEHLTYYGTAEDDEKMIAAACILFPYAIPYSTAYSTSKARYIYSGQHYLGRNDACFFIDAPPVRAFDDRGELLEWANRDLNGDKIKKELPTPQLLRISKSNLKHVEDNPNMVHIDGFFRQRLPDGSYTMDKHAIAYFTSIEVEGIEGYRWLTCLKEINPELWKKFEKVWKCYMDRNNNVHRDLLRKKEVVAHISKLLEFHKFCNDNEGNTDAIAFKSRELFILDVKGAVAYNQEILDDFKELMDFAEPLHPLMKDLEPLGSIDPLQPNRHKWPISTQKIEQIKVYFDSHDRLNWVY